ncbi:MAG TPA: hypothetical protein VJ913_10450 [Actinomycetota bacterium]|nr:hypothetical protein [Actinomycetota bacterium]
MKNAMGVELTPAESSLIECYERLARTLRENGHELPPFARANATKALAALWQVANGHDVEPGQLFDVGA